MKKCGMARARVEKPLFFIVKKIIKNVLKIVDKIFLIAYNGYIG